MEKTYQITLSELQALLKEQRFNCSIAARTFDHYGVNYIDAETIRNAPLPDLSNLKESDENLLASDNNNSTVPCVTPLYDNNSIEHTLKVTIEFDEVEAEIEKGDLFYFNQSSGLPTIYRHQGRKGESWNEWYNSNTGESSYRKIKSIHIQGLLLRTFTSFDARYLLLNSVQSVQECDATKSNRITEPLANNNATVLKESAGMKWVKASERMPKKEGIVVLKLIGVNKTVYAIGYPIFSDEGNYFFASNHFPNSLFYLTNIEWLDESSEEAGQITECYNLRQALTNTVAAWESLPGNRRYTAKEIERWLIENMKPAIDNIRTLLNIEQNVQASVATESDSNSVDDNQTKTN